MIKIWAKTVKNHKIARQCVLERFGKYDAADFFDYLVELCGELDAPTPVILKSHTSNFAKFNHVAFSKGDFMENVNFDRLILENISY